jgi:hypothetical protein
MQQVKFLSQLIPGLIMRPITEHSTLDGLLYIEHVGCLCWHIILCRPVGTGFLGKEALLSVGKITVDVFI